MDSSAFRAPPAAHSPGYTDRGGPGIVATLSMPVHRLGGSSQRPGAANPPLCSLVLGVTLLATPRG